MKMNKKNYLLSVKAIIIFSLFALLSACGYASVSPPPTGASSNDVVAIPSATIEEGKASFLAKKYKLAYQQLLPLAEEGNSDAQYAVAYMLYYGKGVARDEIIAHDWMKKAADQGQPAAKKAVAVM